MQTRLGTALEGRYTIDREIGVGGMATVYLARDVRHNRRVALKVLNPELGAVLGASRFLAEIEVTANLQHPNLLPLFDSGEVDGLLFYVMPYVEGESLRVRLDREKQLPVDETVSIASAIASALGYAHRHNVIHRDLKPENILMQEGQPLIADFGIALAVSNAGGARITQTGLSLGTPQYMSPEQATGDRVVDGRTDIYSLGAITYEMLVGDPPHVASTSQAIIAKLLTEKPASVRASRPNVPPHVDAAIGCALEKLAADRFTTAKEFADALEGKGAIATLASYQPSPVKAAVSRNSRIREIAAWSLVGALAAWLGWHYLRPQERLDAPVIRANFDLPAGARINDAMTGTTIAVSPKGDMIAFTSVTGVSRRMYVRRINEIAARQVSEAAGRNLTFSPDGRWVAFTEGNVLRKVSVDGGQISTVGTTGSAVPYGLSWSKSGMIYVGSFSGMWALPETGGEARRVNTDSSALRSGKRWPLVLPGGKAIAYVAASSPSQPQRLAVMTLEGGKIEEFDLSVAMPLGMLGDQLAYVSPSGGLMAVRFDNSARRPIGDPIQLDEGVLLDATAGAKASLSSSGTLAYLSGRAQFQPVLAASGGPAPTALIREPGNYGTPRFSPDGGRVAISVVGNNTTDIWIYNVARNTFTRLTNEGANIRPEWTPDGRHVIFISARTNKTGIWRQPADGSGPAELLYQPEVEPFEAVMSPDMKWLLVRTSPGAKYPRDILAVPLTGERTVVPLVTGPETESMPRLSPDGKWLAYHSNESGRFEIYVRPFPGSGARIQVSDAGGSEPLWGRSGRSLYYRTQLGEVVEVDVTTGAEFSIGARKVVLTGDYLTDSSHPNYDIAPDGRFLMLKRAGAESQTIVVHNWGAELREKTAARK
ncbi:MAG TPA: protein kinase [Gemmatimonadaceae bacterium]|nr:protein kinase [Gemmatimonadaceae bacterium]